MKGMNLLAGVAVLALVVGIVGNAYDLAAVNAELANGVGAALMGVALAGALAHWQQEQNTERPGVLGNRTVRVGAVVVLLAAAVAVALSLPVEANWLRSAVVLPGVLMAMIPLVREAVEG